MNDKHVKGKRNLLFLSWMGLVFQGVGVVMAFGSLLWDQLDPLGGALFLIFGIALGGWASNLSEFVDLKKRVSELESSNSTETQSQ